MAIGWGDYSSSNLREITTANVRVLAITEPATDSTQGSPVYITYLLESDAGSLATQVDVEYSTDGSNWSNTTADSGDPLHEGTTNLTAADVAITHMFVWDASVDLGNDFQDTSVYVRAKANDGSAWSAYTTSPIFTIDQLPIAQTTNVIL